MTGPQLSESALAIFEAAEDVARLAALTSLQSFEQVYQFRALEM